MTTTAISSVHHRLHPPLQADELLTTKELAAWLRISPRTVYHRVNRGEIPFVRAGGKLLFDRPRIEAWVRQGSVGDAPDDGGSAEATLAGSHDPLLEWAVRSSACGLALACNGSSDGLERLATRRACAALIHLPDAQGEGFNREAIIERLAGLPVVSMLWARREQGLVLARGNPLKIRSLHDLVRGRRRVIRRQTGAGSNQLFAKLMRQGGLSFDRLRLLDQPAQSETEVAESVLDGFADAGLAVRAVAKRHGLDFLPITWETVELVAWRRSVFEPPLQALLQCARSRRFAAHARRLEGYDLGDSGRIMYNA